MFFGLGMKMLSVLKPRRDFTQGSSSAMVARTTTEECGRAIGEQENASTWQKGISTLAYTQSRGSVASFRPLVLLKVYHKLPA